ncbi:MAG: hypothetical protein JWR72_2692 [Flavisolibacter sp.]|nr:hypothetical protein [Flavisolibacter sp.]
MQRYNVFFPVHKGLRAMLFEASLQLQQTTFTNTEEAAAAIESIKTVIAVFESHAQKEDSYVLPAIAAYEPSVVAAFEQEHIEDHQLAESLDRWLTAFGYAVDPAVKQSFGEEVIKAFVQFSVFNLTHMAKEEEVINKILWRYYTDAELHGITQNIMSTIQPAEMALFSKWMVRGMNNNEISGWLKGIKASAPKPVCGAMLSLVESELSTHRWSVVQESLTEGAMVA